MNTQNTLLQIKYSVQFNSFSEKMASGNLYASNGFLHYRTERRLSLFSVRSLYKWVVSGFGFLCLLIGPINAQTEEPELICGMKNVEDMVSIPQSTWIIGSGYGDETPSSGGLYLINSSDNSWTKLDINLPPDLVAQKPFSDCPSPPDQSLFSIHGLSLAKNSDDTYTLYAVNHGGRESVEVFNITTPDKRPEISWAGCISAPDSAHPNSVAALPDGGIVMTSMGDTATEEGMNKLIEGEKTGAVYEWQPNTGWSLLPNSALPGNNGIEVSDDGQWLYVAGWADSSLTRMPRNLSLGDSQTISLDFLADNIRRTRNGSFAVTGQNATVAEVVDCAGKEANSCLLDYKSVTVDPVTLDVTPLYTGTATPSFGAASTTLDMGEALWLGSFRSNCVGKVSQPNK